MFLIQINSRYQTKRHTEGGAGGKSPFSLLTIIIIILLLIKNTYYSRAGPRIAMLV